MINKTMNLQHLQDAVRAAQAQKTPLSLHGGQSKSFYGRETMGDALDISEYTGITSYEPSELVITAKAGTPLRDIQQTLSEQGQYLAFEPPHFGEHATFGGMVACGLSGTSRPYVGAVRDFILGVQCINGHAQALKFGGQVMKNVAGYDVSRLMVGALGTLSVLTEISCKVSPRPPETLTLTLACDNEKDALAHMYAWHQQNLPLSGLCFDGQQLSMRLSGSHLQSIQQALQNNHPLVVNETGNDFWADLTEHRLSFFTDSRPLWRISLPTTAPLLTLAGNTFYEWGGAQRWLYTDIDATEIREQVSQLGGHATLFRGGNRKSAVFHPLPPALKTLHQRLKQQFDPAGIFNPHRMSLHW